MGSARGGSELTVFGNGHATDDGIDVRAFASFVEFATTIADLHPADVQRRGMSPHAIASYGCAGLCTLIE